MTILEVLNCVKRLSLAGLLKKSHPLLVSKLQQKLSDPDGPKNSPVHPAKVFLVLKVCNNSSREFKRVLCLYEGYTLSSVLLFLYKLMNMAEVQEQRAFEIAYQS